MKVFLQMIRKGNKEQIVYFSQTAMADLQDFYIQSSKYQVDKNNKALFIAAPIGPKKIETITVRAREKLVEKYAKPFGKP